MRAEARAAAAAALCVAGLAGCGAQEGGTAAGTATTPTATPPTAVAPAGLDGDAVGGLPCPAADPAAEPVADSLPQLLLPCLAGGPDVDLAAVRGVPMVVNVWASWCAPCRQEMPLLGALATAAGDDLRVLGISVLDDRAAAARVATEVPLASVYDRGGKTRASLGWSGPPVTYYVAASGQVVGRTVGQLPDAQTLRAEVARYLGVQVS
jgi:thiol-disulfide isomerase/thioredoxin